MNALPCYFCDTNGSAVGDLVRTGGFSVGCLHCYAEGPVANSVTFAIAGWNAAMRQDRRVMSDHGLLVCPWCDSADVNVWIFGRRFGVCCDNPTCRARGPQADNEAAAIAAWNFPDQ